jgi:hypothetical protein
VAVDGKGDLRPTAGEAELHAYWSRQPLGPATPGRKRWGVVEEDGKDITQSVIDSILVRQESMNRFVRAATIEPITGSKESFHKGLLLDIACNNPKSAGGSKRFKMKDMPPHQENEEGEPTAGWGKYALERGSRCRTGWPPPLRASNEKKEKPGQP